MSIKESAAMPDSGSTSNESTSAQSEPLEISGGDQVISFDQLDQVKSNVKEENTSKKAKDVDSKEASKEKEEDGAKEDKEDSKKEHKDTIKEKVASKKATDRIYKIKVGDKDVDLSASGVLDIDVGGKPVSVSVQDLVNGYHGSSEISRRMSAIDRDRKAFEVQQKSLHNTFKKINDLYASKNQDGLLDFIIEEAGLDAETYKLDLYEKLAPTVSEWSALTPEEKQMRRLKVENEALKKTHAKQQKNYDSEKSYQEIQSQVSKIQNDYGLTNEAFYDLYQELVHRGISENDITPEKIAGLADEKAVSNYVKEKIVAISPKYENIDALTETLVEELSVNASLNLDDLDDFIKSLINEEADEQLEEKVQPKKKTRETINSNDLISWDQLE